MTTVRPLATCLLAALALLSPALPAATPGCGLVPVGCEAWSATHAGGEQWSQDILASPDGMRVFITARQDLSEGTVVAIMAHDTGSGRLIWNTTYTEQNIPETHAMAASPDGALLHIAGMGFVGPYARITEGLVLTYDALTGALLWVRHGPLDSDANAVTTSADGSVVYVAGGWQNDYRVVALDAHDGTQLWETIYDGHGGNAGTWRRVSYDEPFDIVERNRKLLVTGISAGPDGQLEYATIALDAETGSQNWVARFHGKDANGEAISSEAYAIELAPNGHAAYVLGTGGLAAIDQATGAKLWNAQDTRCRPYWPMFNHECVLEVNPTTGEIYVFTERDLAAYEPDTGELLWHNAVRLDEEWPISARGMVMAPDGARLYITTPAGFDSYVTDPCSCFTGVYETRSFDTADGSLRWRVTNGDGRQSVEGIDISPNGDNVFVTGMYYPRGRQAESLTVSYPTRLGLDNPPKLSFPTDVG